MKDFTINTTHLKQSIYNINITLLHNLISLLFKKIELINYKTNHKHKNINFEIR